MCETYTVLCSNWFRLCLVSSFQHINLDEQEAPATKMLMSKWLDYEERASLAWCQNPCNWVVFPLCFALSFYQSCRSWTNGPIHAENWNQNYVILHMVVVNLLYACFYLLILLVISIDYCRILVASLPAMLLLLERIIVFLLIRATVFGWWLF